MNNSNQIDLDKENYKKEFFKVNELKKIKWQFTKYANKNNMLTINNFKLFLKGLAINLNIKASNLLFKFIDSNKDGYIKYEEVFKYLYILNRGGIIERISFIFDIMDIDTKGFLTFNDIKNYFNILLDENEKEYHKKLNSFLNFFYLNFNKNIIENIKKDEFIINLKNNYELMDILNIFSVSKDLNQINIDNVYNDLLFSIEKIIINLDNFLISIYGEDSDKYKEFCKIKTIERESIVMNYINKNKISKLSKSITIDKNINDNNDESYFSDFFSFEKNKSKTINNIKNILNEIKNLKIKILNHKNESKINNFSLKNESRNFKYFKKNWPFIVCMMKGISKSICLENMNLDLIDSESINEFMTKNIFEILPPQNDWFDKCYFYDYFSNVFMSIRNFLGVNNLQFNRAVGVQAIQNFFINESLKEVLTEGKSLSFFYFSTDKKYIIKTIKKNEFNKLKKWLPDYYKYLKKNKTLITKFFGCHSLKLYRNNILKNEIFIVIMENIFANSKNIIEKYDLKGSTYKRETKINNNNSTKCYTKKDNNLLKENRKFQLSWEARNDLINIIKKDAYFLMKHNIIYYSLIIGIELNNSNLVENNEIYEYFSKDGSNKYYIGIIDTFTNFDIFKIGVYSFKTIFHGKGISIKPPKLYAERFINFLEKIIIS